MESYNSYELDYKSLCFHLISAADPPIRITFQPYTLLVWPSGSTIVQLGVVAETPNGEFGVGDEFNLERLEEFRREIAAFAAGPPDVVMLGGASHEILICHRQGNAVLAANLGLRYRNSVDQIERLNGWRHSSRLSVACYLDLHSLQELISSLDTLCSAIGQLKADDQLKAPQSRQCTPRRTDSPSFKPIRYEEKPDLGIVVGAVSPPYEMHEPWELPSVELSVIAETRECLVTVREGMKRIYRCSEFVDFNGVSEFVQNVRRPRRYMLECGRLYDGYIGSIALSVGYLADERIFLKFAAGSSGSLTELLRYLNHRRRRHLEYRQPTSPTCISHDAMQCTGFEILMQIDESEHEKLLKELPEIAAKLKR